MLSTIKTIILDIEQAIPPFDYLIFASVFTTLLSLADMNDAIRFIILLVTAIGAVVKVIEQIGTSKKTMYLLNKIAKWRPRKTS
jgi:hypothetical protein